MSKRFKRIFNFYSRLFLACVFFLYAYKAFLLDVELIDIVRNSFLINLPFLSFYRTIFLMGILNIVLGIFLISGLFPKISAVWIFLWTMGIFAAFGTNNLIMNAVFLFLSLYLIWAGFFHTDNILKFISKQKQIAEEK